MTWHSSKIIFLEMGPNNVIEGGESDNRSPGARTLIVYATVNRVGKIKISLKRVKTDQI